MSSKKKSTGNPNMQTLRIGSRVRCTDDGVEGRIVWANALSVKVEWQDGEKVTWKRDSLAGRPIQILDAEADGGETEASPIAVEQTATEAAIAEPAIVPEAETAATTEVPAAEAPAQEPPPAEPADSSTEATPAPARPKRQPKAPAQPKGKKVSALDAAARVLAEENRPMTCKEMVETMAAKGYWASPGGKTPEATLYTAVTMLPKVA
jgi:hypothetical protein